VGSPGDGRAVVAAMKATPVDDALFGHVAIREDGRAVHDMYLLQVKQPDEAKGEWDLFRVSATIPADQAFRPLNEGGCPLVTKAN
jgi:branched-chain amino acid transport system substrate-binding protein